MKIKPQYILLAILVVIIIIQQARIQFKKPVIRVDDSVRELYQDSLAALQNEIDLADQRYKNLEKDYTEILLSEKKVIYRYRDKIKFVYTTADPDVLDSIIRSNWKTDPGYSEMLRNN